MVLMADRRPRCKRIIYRILAGLACSLCFESNLVGQESVDLQINHAKHGTSRVTLTLQVKGDVQREVQVASQAKIQPADPVVKTLSFPLSVGGRLMYDEVLSLDETNSAVASQSVRYYHHADANIQVGKHSDKIRLRDDRRLLRADASTALASVDGPISREELDLVKVPGNSLLLDRLLPNRSVRTGESFSSDVNLFGRLLNWSSVESGDLRSELKQVANGLAVISMTGTLTGLTDAAESTVEVRGEYRYDVHWGRITWLQLDLNESRKVGLVHPAFDVATQLRMRVEPLKSSTALTDAVVVSALQSDVQGPSQLHLKPRASDIELIHDPRWHVTSDQPRRTVMRCLHQDELLAQLTISELAMLPAGRELSLEAFQTEIRTALGDRFVEFTSADHSEQRGFRTLRVVATGKVGDVPIQWVYYHVNDKSGRRAAFVYILESENLETFGQTDREMVAQFAFRPRSKSTPPGITTPTETARQPSSKQSTATRSNYRQNGQARAPSRPVR